MYPYKVDYLGYPYVEDIYVLQDVRGSSQDDHTISYPGSDHLPIDPEIQPSDYVTSIVSPRRKDRYTKGVGVMYTCRDVGPAVYRET